ncbi:tRNA synthetases class I (M)-domain-containing protein [Cytidiella melzeri]|nr:tRNA synthetases class I (M)-domain-containing protein [Cytidiella melzeri]
MLRFPNGALKRATRCPQLHRVRHSSTNATQPGSKPYYITTPIFYPNSVPHIGHLHSVVIADIFARYARLVRPESPVYFMTGTDEHGLKIQKAARERGMDPLAFCDEISQHFRNLTQKANISNTRFSRTTDHAHHTAVQHLWRQLDAKGLIYKGNHEGWYSISDECFYTDSQIVQLPPSVGIPEEYYISTETRSRVEWTQEENYKFRLSAFQGSLMEHFKQHPEAIYPPQHHADVLTILSNPLDDLSVSRPSSRLSWGVPVPDDAAHTIYVWIDALTVYLSATGYPWPSVKAGSDRGWPPNLQIIGKDILRFHAIYFPAMLQALDLPLTTQLLTHSHWTVDQRKMSKSVGNVADPIQAIDEYGLDVVRYYLARVGGRFKDDVDWSRDQLEKHSREIMSLLGNLYLRITSKKIQQRVEGEERQAVVHIANQCSEGGTMRDLLSAVENLNELVQKRMQGLLVADALDDIMSTLQKGNQLLTETAPWAASTSIATTVDVYTVILEVLRVSGILLQPFIPSKAEQLLDALEIAESQRSIAYASLGGGSIGQVTGGIRLFETTESKK